MKDQINKITITLTTPRGNKKKLSLSPTTSTAPDTEYEIKSTDKIAVKIQVFTFIVPVRWPGLLGKSFNWDTFLNTDILTENTHLVTEDQLTQFRNMLAAHQAKEISERPEDKKTQNFGRRYFKAYIISTANHPTFGPRLDKTIDATLPILASLIAPKALSSTASHFGYHALSNSGLASICSVALVGFAAYKLQNAYLKSHHYTHVCEAMVKTIFSSSNTDLKESGDALAHHLIILQLAPAIPVALCYTASAYIICSGLIQ